jgi:dCMP deaminase
MRSPRETPCRDDRYMGLAFFHASFSKDPNTQVGAVIVNEKNEIVGTGYNGPPRRIDDNKINWERPYKYRFIKHAEANAIDHALIPTENTTLYVTGIPCQKCMLEIADAGISKVIYFDMSKIVDPFSMLSNNTEMEITSEIAALSGIELQPYSGSLEWMRDRINFLDVLGLFNI